jgi:hypothetical protein
MGKSQHAHRPHPRSGSWPLSIVTLGFYGLPHFRPRWLYSLTAISFLAGWLVLAFVAGMVRDGAEYLFVPPVFVMVIVTFLRLIPAAPRHPAGAR